MTRALLACALIVLALEVPLSDLPALQALDSKGRQAKFRLPTTCDPLLSAAQAGDSGQVLLVVTCAPTPPPSGSPPQPLPSPGD